MTHTKDICQPSSCTSVVNRFTRLIVIYFSITLNFIFVLTRYETIINGFDKLFNNTIKKIIKIFMLIKINSVLFDLSSFEDIHQQLIIGATSTNLVIVHRKIVIFLIFTISKFHPALFTSFRNTVRQKQLLEMKNILVN